MENLKPRFSYVLVFHIPHLGFWKAVLVREGHEDDDVDDGEDDDGDDGVGHEDDLRFLAACQGEMDGALTHTSPCPLLIPHKHKHKLKDKHKHLQSLKGECKSPHPKSYKCRDKYFILGQYGFATEVIRL